METRAKLVAEYRAELVKAAETGGPWDAADAAWERLCAWDNDHRDELPAWREGAVVGTDLDFTLR